MILNLTQHAATPEQLDAGVVDLPAHERAELQRLLTFQIGGECGLAANLSAAPGHVAARAREIASRFAAPRLADALRAMHGACASAYTDTQVLNIFRAEPVGLRALIGGAPFLMAPLERALLELGVTPVYSLSDRVSVEQTLPDGTVRKSSVFRYAGFMPACE